MHERPNIVEVISSFVSLRKSGQEFVGFCPFHSEKHPSFSVNEGKGLFYCFGCGEGGDVITFVEKIQKVDFKGALHFLGITKGLQSRKQIREFEQKRARAREIFWWAQAISNRVASALRNLGQKEWVAEEGLHLPSVDKSLLAEELALIRHQWDLLEVFHDALGVPETVIELWEQREIIEALVEELQNEAGTV
jgi:DNA primase catalytic core